MSLEEVDVAVLCGGKNSRTEILSDINGKPYLDWLIDRLKLYGAKRVVLCTVSPVERLQEWLSTKTNDGVDIEFSIEPFQSGTGSAIRHAREMMKTNPVLVMNGDTISNANLGVFLKYHAGGSLTALESRRYPTSAYRPAGHYLISQAILDDIVQRRARSLEDYVHAKRDRRVMRSGVYFDIATPGAAKNMAFFFENMLEVA
jgi:NDP-sugar pyrophosphorylase family protein